MAALRGGLRGPFNAGQAPRRLSPMTAGGAKLPEGLIFFVMPGVNTTEVAARWGAFLRDPQNVDVAAGLKVKVKVK